MAIAFDAVTTDTGGGGWSGSPRDISHTPVGTPRGILCLILASDASDVVSGVTYGGTAMTRVAAGTKISTVSTEGGSVYAYFLGAGVPTGTQTCSITNSATLGAAVVISLTAAANTEVDAANTLDQSSGTNPSVSLSTTASTETFIAGALWSGQNSTSGVAPGGSYTELAVDDFGSQVVSFERRTSNGTGGSITVDWTAGSEDAVVGAVAIREAGNVFTGSAALTVGKAALAGTAHTITPTFSAAGPLRSPHAVFAGTASSIYHASGPLIAPAVDFAAAALFSSPGPLVFASAALTVGNVELTAAGLSASGPLVFASAGALQTRRAAFAGAATFTAPTYEGTADLTTAPAAFAGSALFDEPGPLVFAFGSLVIGSAEFAATGETDPIVHASATLAIPPVGLVATGDTNPALFTATAGLNAGNVEFAGTASFCVGLLHGVARNADVFHLRRTATVENKRRYSRASNTAETCP